MLVGIVNSSQGYASMIRQMGHDVVAVNSVLDVHETDFTNIDIVLFTGGADINPDFYGHSKHPTTQVWDAADDLYLSAWTKAGRQCKDPKFIGICRGSQFVCAMSGGELIQDCDNHAVGMGHKVFTKYGEGYHVTSTHHQMQFPNKAKHKVVAWAEGLAENAEQHINGKKVPVNLPIDYEVVGYPETKALGFQPHPEFKEGSCRDLFIRCFEEYFGE